MDDIATPHDATAVNAPNARGAHEELGLDLELARALLRTRAAQQQSAAPGADTVSGLGAGGGSIHIGQRIYVQDGAAGSGGSANEVELHSGSSSSTTTAKSTAAAAAAGSGTLGERGHRDDYGGDEPAQKWSRRDFIVTVSLFGVVIVLLLMIYVAQRPGVSNKGKQKGPIPEMS